ncbi:MULTISPECIES: hypothetical protein [unclassified Bradyrhizobium]|uniref:hypothetical protein n=1 Tax=unclassified Bradyrhizobium TaxID=2631580 RepID=UPI000402BF1B|nr:MULTISPECIES: hypothetical protein [unclassified Bradyrhizobium]MCP3463880.1 hypothetical protein [Bradyrhizobium sp. CCGUVB23]
MRESEPKGWMMRSSMHGLLRSLKLTSVALGIGLVMAAGAARAGDDDEEDDRTFEEKLIDNLMSGLGAQGGRSLEKPGIEYRERSPLVVPPKLDLPPPASSAEAAAPNWPKDPDERRRKELAAARKKSGTKFQQPWEAARPLTPAEMNAAKTNGPTRTTSNEPGQPTQNNPTLSPAQLGYTGGLFKLFKGDSNEAAEFKSEPPRGSLTEPPPGYQTPSPNYAYGSGGPDKTKKTYYDVQSGKEKEQ